MYTYTYIYDPTLYLYLDLYMCIYTYIMFAYSKASHSTWYRVSLWALVMGPFDSGGVCSTGPGIVYDM